MRQSSLLINIALSIFSVILIYALLEGTFSYIESRKPPNSFWVLSSAETFVFDPVSGFRLTRVPSRSELLARDYDRFYKQDTQAFANTIDASFYDATDAFSMLSDEEIRDHWLPYDGHWNLRGSDRFGRFVVSRIGEQLYASYAQ